MPVVSSFHHDGIHLGPLANVDKSHRSIGLPVGKLAEVAPINRYAVRVRFHGDLDVEVGSLLDRAATVALLNAPATELVGVTYDDLIPRANTDVQGGVVTGIHVRARLEIDVELIVSHFATNNHFAVQAKPGRHVSEEGRWWIVHWKLGHFDLSFHTRFTLRLRRTRVNH